MTGATGATGVAGQEVYNTNFAIIGATNVSGNGTFYLTAGAGATANVDMGVLAPVHCNQLSFDVVLNGPPPNPYTFEVLRRPSPYTSGTSLPTGAICTVSPAIQSCSVSVSNAVQASDMVQVRMIGTDTFQSWGGNMYATLSCKG